jgi:hypothetical protein
MKILTWGAAALAVLTLVSASVAIAGHSPPNTALQGADQKKTPTPEEAQVAALQQEYQNAMMVYQKPLRDAKTPEEARSIKLDPEKHPAKEFYPKFRDLAVKLGKNPAALGAWMMARSTAMMTRNTEGADAAFEAILKDFINSDAAANFAGRLVVPGDTQEQMTERTEAALGRIERESKNSEVLAAVLSRRAGLYSKDATKVADINKQLVEKYPGTMAGKRAKAAIFEAENLVVGKTAPDFESEDVDGKKFKLSDYRGKVVVLEFWGFW